MAAAMDDADVTVRDQPSQHRFEVLVGDSVAGFVTYRDEGGALAFLHTEVDDAYEGRGLGSTLVGQALATARDRGVGVLPYCEFVQAYLKKHAELRSLVPEDARERFVLG
jgi:uncharacterized protein